MIAPDEDENLELATLALEREKLLVEQEKLRQESFRIKWIGLTVFMPLIIAFILMAYFRYRVLVSQVNADAD